MQLRQTRKGPGLEREREGLKRKEEKKKAKIDKIGDNRV
jgi:hypothetical protein